MKKLRLTEKNGFSQIFVLLGMLLIAVALPIATNLVQQNQENRSNAAEVQCESSDTKCEGGYKYTCSSHKWKKTTIKCGTTPATTCTYTVSWGACKPGGTKVGVLKASPEGCTGGTKPATVANCTYVAPVTRDCACGTTAGTCSLGTAAWKDQYGTSGSYTWSCTGSSCNPKNCSITNSNPPSSSASPKCGTDSYTCMVGTHSGLQTGSNGITRWTCTSGSSSITCTYTPPTSTTNAVTCSLGTYGTRSVAGSLCIKNSSGVSYQYTCQSNGAWKMSTCSSGCSGDTCAIATTGCSAAGGFCTYDATGCKAAKGSYSDSDCSGGQVCCTGVTKGNLYYYYSSSTKTCLSTSVYSSLSTCAIAKGVTCYEDVNTCEDKNGVGADCVCGTSGKSDGTKYKDAPTTNLCESPAVAFGVGSTNTDGNWTWRCQGNSCKTKTCSATRKTGGSPDGGNPGGSTGGTSTVTVTPDELTLKVGESATVVASESVTWASDPASIATVTSDGVVTGVAVGSAVVTATNSVGTTATVAVTVISSETGTLSFKVAFSGIKASYINNDGESYGCLGSLGDLTVGVLNRTSNIFEEFSGVQVSVVGNELDSKDNQVFQVSNLDVGSSFVSADNNNYVKVKGPFHLKMRMCKDGQSGKLDDTTVCDVDLTSSDSYVYDFSEYTLLAGDVNQDGVINSIDFSLVKNAVAPDAEIECGRAYDLNLNGVVNSQDLQLVKEALSSKDDE